MEGFTPSFFLQLIIAIASGGVAYGAIRSDLSRLQKDYERMRYRLHAPENPQNLVSQLQAHESRLALLEQKRDD